MKYAIHIRLTGLNWVYLRKRNSVKFWFLFQWNMPSLEHFIINQK